MFPQLLPVLFPHFDPILFPDHCRSCNHTLAVPVSPTPDAHVRSHGAIPLDTPRAAPGLPPLAVIYAHLIIQHKKEGAFRFGEGGKSKKQ